MLNVEACWTDLDIAEIFDIKDTITATVDIITKRIKMMFQTP